MRIISKTFIKDYYTKNPQAKAALIDWAEKTEAAQWHNFADIKRTFNSVNATLAAMAGKGFCDKAKAVFGDKMLTQYTLTEAGIAELDKVEEETAE